MTELSTRYNPKEIEGRLYEFLESKGFFKPVTEKGDSLLGLGQKAFIFI